jgi:[acyl-carrier-protein] S-malonyltransferase
MSLGLLFPGQGTQHPQMLAWLEAAATNAPAHEVLHAMQGLIGGEWRQRLTDPTWAFCNEVAQPLLTGCSLGAWAVLQPHLPMPRVVAGYSVGELAAFSAGGVFDAATALQLAVERARCMDACVAPDTTGLMALHGLDAAQLESLCIRHGIYPAIQLGPCACIVGGLVDHLADAADRASHLGAKFTRLSVPLASHTPLLAPAVNELQAVFSARPFARATSALVCNVHGYTERGPHALRHALAQQVGRTVQWATCMTSVREAGVTCVLEVGAGRTLSQLWNATYPDIPARSVDEFLGPGGVLAWVQANSSGL